MIKIYINYLRASNGLIRELSNITLKEAITTLNARNIPFKVGKNPLGGGNITELSNDNFNEFTLIRYIENY